MHPSIDMKQFKLRILSVSASIGLQFTAFCAAAEGPQPLDHFRGNRLQELRRSTLEGAKSAANAGAGYEAARLLQGLASNNIGDEISKQATALLEDWGLTNVRLDDTVATKISEQVRQRLQLEFQTQVDLAQIETLIEFQDFPQAGSLLSTIVTRPLIGNAEKSLVRFSAQFGLPASEGFAQIRASSESKLAELLENASLIVQRIEAHAFLSKADPQAGAIYGALLQKLHPNAEKIRQARNASQANERSRFGGFGRRVMPPGLAARFGRQFGGRTPEREQSDEGKVEVELTVDAVISSLDYLAKDDTELAIDLLNMSLLHFSEAPERMKLETMLKQADLYLMSLQADSNEGAAVHVDRFDKKRKKGKAAEIFSGDWIPTYELTISQDEWAKLKGSPKDYVHATFKSGETILSNIGVRLKGGIGSYRPLERGNKIGLTLKLNQFEKGQKFLGLRKIMLNNSVQDESYLREGLGYELFRQAGLPASRVGHANLIVNGEPYGLYVQIEAVTSDFLSRWFQDGKGTLYEGSYGSDVDNWEDLELDSNPELADREHVRVLSEAADKTMNEGSLAPLEGYLDTRAFTRFMALEVLMDHWDGYISANNYRLYRDTKTEKFYFIPHGADQLFRNSGGELLRNSRGKIGQAIMETSEGRELYLAQVDDLLANVIQADNAREKLIDRYHVVRSHAALDPKNSNTLMEFDRTVKTTLQFFNKKQRMARWQQIALDDPALERRLESLNQDSRRSFGGRGRGGRR